MNAERLHIIALTLRQELTQQTVVDRLQALVNAIQAIGQQNTQSTQQNFVSSRDAFYAAVTNTLSDSFTPAWRQILTEMGGEELFGKDLKESVQRILADNQATLGVASPPIQQILTRLETFQTALDQLIKAFTHFKIGSEKLASGEVEIALLIPREAVHNKLVDFADELDEMEFILNTLSEVATGQKDDLRIRTISSSGLMVFLAASPEFGAIIARVVDFIVGQYKRILEIKKLHLDIERLQLPDEISEKTKQYANTVMGEAVDKLTVELISEYVGDDGGRKNELTTAVKISLNRVANRIDQGFNFEVRIEPPKDSASDADGEIRKAVQTIQGASVNMRYMKLEGPPILALPEKVEVAAEGDTKDKKKSVPKKDEAK